VLEDLDEDESVLGDNPLTESRGVPLLWKHVLEQFQQPQTSETTKEQYQEILRNIRSKDREPHSEEELREHLKNIISFVDAMKEMLKSKNPAETWNSLKNTFDLKQSFASVLWIMNWCPKADRKKYGFDYTLLENLRRASQFWDERNKSYSSRTGKKLDLKQDIVSSIFNNVC
jgi:hypothetical protein